MRPFTPRWFCSSLLFISAGPVHDLSAECRADRPRVGAVSVGGDALGDNAGHRLGRAEEGLGRRHVAVLAQHGIDEIAVTVDGAVQIAPPATNLQVSLVDVPVTATSAAPATPALTEFIGQQRGELRLPLAGRFVTEDDPADEEHLG